MANIKITEVDATTAGLSAAATDIVYIPGFVSASASDWEASTLAKAFSPQLCETISAFESYFGTEPATFAETQTYPDEFSTDAIPSGNTTMFDKGQADPSYIMAKELINLGIPVLYERINVDDQYGQPVDPKVSAMYEALSGKNYDYPDIFQNLKDKGEYSVKYLTTGGYPSFEYKGVEYNTSVDKTGLAAPENTTISVDSRMFIKKVWNKQTQTAPSPSYKFEYKPTTNSAYSWFIDNDTTPIAYLADYGITFRGVPSTSHDETEHSDKTASFEGDGTTKEFSLVIPTGATNITTRVIVDSTVVAATDYTVANSKITFTNAPAAPSTPGTSNILVEYSYDVVTTVYDSFKVNVAEVDAGSIIVSRMLDCASNRGDSVALIDHTNNNTRSLNPVSRHSVYWAVSNSESEFYIQGDAEFGAMFTPWATYTCPKIGASVVLPASYGYLTALAKSVRTNANWLAVAGASRGVVPNFVSLNTDERMTNAIADSYQPRDAVAINPITNIKPYGYTIWGNRTLKNNGVEGNLTATSFLNIRNLVSEVKKVAYTSAKRCMFEQNSDVLWVTFKALLTPTLDKMVSGYGLSGYKVLKGKTTEKAKLVCNIKLYPLYAVEDFDITVYMEDEDVTVI